MSLDLNWVDLVILGVLTLFALEALGKPLISEFLDFVSFVLAGLLSFRYYNFPAKFFESNFQIPHGLSLVFGFTTVWFLSEVIFYLLVRILLPKIPRVKIPGANSLSTIPAVLRGLTFIAVTLVLTSTFPIQPAVKKAAMESKLGGEILKYAYRLERPIKNVFGGVTNDTLTFLTIKPRTDERVNLGFQTLQVSPDPIAEDAMVALVNKERLSKGLKALVVDAQLRTIGRAHSEDMFKRGYFSHYSLEGLTVADRASEVGVDFLVIGENLAYAPSVGLAHQGFMNSEGHRANILSPDYGRIGIGVVDGGVYGKMFTQVFAD